MGAPLSDTAAYPHSPANRFNTQSEICTAKTLPTYWMLCFGNWRDSGRRQRVSCSAGERGGSSNARSTRSVFLATGRRITTSIARARRARRHASGRTPAFAT